AGARGALCLRLSGGARPPGWPGRAGGRGPDRDRGPALGWPGPAAAPPGRPVARNATVTTSTGGSMSKQGRFSRRDMLKIGAVAGAGAAIRLEAPTLFQGASASVQVPQTPLPGASIAQFAEPVPTYFGKRASGPHLQVGMFEFQQKVLPDAFYATLPDGFKRGTYVWGYACG